MIESGIMFKSSNRFKSLINKALNLPLLDDKRIVWVDYLRGITIILVVYRHVLIGLERSGIRIPSFVATANMIFFTFRMPIFFILSGIFVQSLLSKKSIRQIIINKLDLILYPYFIWSVIQISLQIFFSNFTNSTRGWQDYLFIFYQPRAIDQMWYLPALFNTTIIYILIKSKCKAKWWLQVILGIVFYLIIPYMPRISILRDWMEFYIFFALGDILSTYFKDKKIQKAFGNPLYLFILFPIFIFSQIFFLSHNVSLIQQFFIAMIGCTFMFVIAFQLQKFNRISILRILGYHSLYIYVMHVIISAFTRMILFRYLNLQDPIILLLLGIISGLLVPVVLYNLLLKDRFWFLFTTKKATITNAQLNKISIADSIPLSDLQNEK